MKINLDWHDLLKGKTLEINDEWLNKVFQEYARNCMSLYSEIAVTEHVKNNFPEHEFHTVGSNNDLYLPGEGWEDLEDEIWEEFLCWIDRTRLEFFTHESCDLSEWEITEEDLQTLKDDEPNEAMEKAIRDREESFTEDSTPLKVVLKEIIDSISEMIEEIEDEEWVEITF